MSFETDTVVGHDTGVEFKIGSTFEEVPNVVSCKPPGSDRASIRTTHLKSPKHKSRPGLPNSTDMTVVINYNPDDPVHQALHDSRLEEDHDWRITTSDGIPTTVTGWTRTWEKSDIVVDGLNQVTITIEVNEDEENP